MGEKDSKRRKGDVMQKPIKKSEIDKMPMWKAKEIVLRAANGHLKGAGCGPGHRIPQGEERRELQIAMAKIYKSIHHHLPPRGMYSISYDEVK